MMDNVYSVYTSPFGVQVHFNKCGILFLLSFLAFGILSAGLVFVLHFYFWQGVIIVRIICLPNKMKPNLSIQIVCESEALVDHNV